MILNIITDNNLEKQVDFQTRKDNILDLITTGHPSYKLRCKALKEIGNSDHDIFLYDTNLRPQRPKPTRRKIYLWKRANILVNTILDVCFSFILDYDGYLSLSVASNNYGLAYPILNPGPSMRKHCHYALFVSWLETYL